MRRKMGFLFMISGAVLLIAALSLAVYNMLDNMRAGREAETVLSELKTAEEEKGGSEVSFPAYNRPADGVMPSVEIDGRFYVGTLSIPSLELELPVIEEWSYSGLKTAPCRYYGSVWTDDLVIAGHNYNSHFGRLKYLTEGAQVVFTDILGNVFGYEVDFIETLSPTAIDEMTSADCPLTLFTCDYSGRARIALRCRSR